MSKIKGNNTIPEEIVRKFLFSKGLRFRKNDGRYPGRPDIVVSKYRTIVFVNGCFWHCHKDCKDFSLPKSNTDFWMEKLQRNVERDEFNIKKLTEDGWKVLVVWECELKKRIREEHLEQLYQEIIINRKTGDK